MTNSQAAAGLNYQDEAERWIVELPATEPRALAARLLRERFAPGVLAEVDRVLTYTAQALERRAKREKRVDPAQLVTAAELVAEGRRLTTEGVRYVVEDLIPAFGMLGFLVGYAKVGKSTAGQVLVRSIARGEPFLGRETRRKRVLYLALEDPREYLSWMAARALHGDEDALFYSGSLVLDPPTMREVEDLVRVEGVGFVYVSTFTAGIRGLIRDENDNAGLARVVEELKASARRTGVPFLFEAHSGKGEDGSSDADPARAMRGASAAAGAADYLLSLRRDGRGMTTRRVLTGAGRFVSFPPIAFDYDPATGAIEYAGERGGASAETDWSLLMETGAITPEWRTASAIARAAGMPEKGEGRDRVRRALMGRPGVEKLDRTSEDGTRDLSRYRLAGSAREQA